MRIKFKKTAVEDMRATERYIREQLNNPSAAAKLTRRVYDAIMLLEDNPFMGTELCSRYADIRFLVVAKQIVFYRVVGNEYVEVTRVLDGRQDYMALLF
jgi:plasmid stabilization system protein ParE